MQKRSFYLFFLGFLFSTSIKAVSLCDNFDDFSFIEEVTQDKAVMIRKIEARISALQKKRTKLKELDKWTGTNEKKYQLKIEKLQSNLEKLGHKSVQKLTKEQQIKKIQKQLKSLHNARVNKNAKEAWTKEDNDLYEKKAGALIKRIVNLRSKAKN